MTLPFEFQEEKEEEKKEEFVEEKIGEIDKKSIEIGGFATKGMFLDVLSGSALDPLDRARRAIPVTLIADATVVSVTGATETEANLVRFNFRFNNFILNRAIRIYAAGVYTTTVAGAADTVVIRIGTGGAPVTEWNSMTSTAATVTNAPWWLEWIGIINAVGSSGTMEAQMRGRINNVNKDDPNTATISLDTTALHTFSVTSDWSAAADDADTISIRQFIVQIL